MSLVVGADSCSKGWILAAINNGQDPELQFVSSFGEALRAFPAADVFAIDIPIGLPERNPRPADMEARAFIAPRGSSVFPSPPVAVLDAPTYADGLVAAQEATGTGISRQAWALLPKIHEVAEFSSDERVFEVHPEVSFRAIAGTPILTSKKTWNGIEQRRNLLGSVGLRLPNTIGEPGDRGAPDDILDALAACWSASRIARGEAVRLPGDSTDRAPAIWY